MTTSSESQTRSMVNLRSDTQDSEIIYEALREELGVETLSASTAGDQGTSINGLSDNETVALQKDVRLENENDQVVGWVSSAGDLAATRSQSSGVHSAYQTREADRDHANSQKKQTSTAPNRDKLDPRQPPGRSTSAPTQPNDDELNNRPNGRINETDSQNLSVQHDGRKLLNRDNVPTGPPPARKMDVSQQTPTQVNEDRDYDEGGGDELPWNEGMGDSLLPTHEDQSLVADDTGAVNFGELSQFGRPSSQVSEDGGIGTTSGDWRLRDQTSQQVSSHLYTPFKPQEAAFETPVAPRNPFGDRSNAGAVPLAGSQLFGQTQLLSSAMKKASPTSSRPSPHVLPNSFSPNLPETSPFKDRHNVSSPTDIRTSSPQRLNEVPETEPRRNHLERIEEETPSHSRSTGDEIIPESPTHKASRLSTAHQPLENYETMKASQQRKTSDGAEYDFVGSDSESEDDAMRRLERKRRAEKKRALAIQEMDKVTVTQSLPQGSNEQSNNKRRRVTSELKTNRFHGSAESVIAQSDGVETSQLKAPSQAPATDDVSTQGTEESNLENEGKNQDNTVQIAEPPKPVMNRPSEECVPATSPALPNVTQSGSSLSKLGFNPQQRLTASLTVTPISSSPKPAKVEKTYGAKSRQSRRATVISSSASEALSKELGTSPRPVSSPPSSPTPSITPLDEKNTVKEAEGEQDGIPPTSPKQSSQVTVTAQDGTAGRITPAVPEAIERATSSSLSSLSSSPSPTILTSPSKHKPQAQETIEAVESTELSRRHSNRHLRSRILRSNTDSISPQAVTRSLRNTKRPRYDSESTDELLRSPSQSVLERSLVNPKAGRNFRNSLCLARQDGGLFDGMVFALSFNQSKPQDRTRLEARIEQAGGVILPEGFEPLFQQSAVLNTTAPIHDHDEPLELTESFSDGGFTAVIADGHSRKPKYMQALALGLPCLAHQWITACLNKGMVVDWEPYLLCSGSSAVLDNAIRSRKLETYPADKARLAYVVEHRKQLLQGQRLLIVMDSKKGRAEAKQPYVFLAQALGPMISRVFTIQQAQQTIKNQSKAGRQPFDWVYVDKSAGSPESMMAALTAGGSGKKRKRSHAAAAVSMEGIPRVLNDELVIQSLILGRMVEEGEINF